jgi:undecaprenyl-diphosphatase
MSDGAECSQDTVSLETGVPSGEVAVLAAVQAAIAKPEVVTASRAMSHFGEHALGWIALATVGALTRPNRQDWVLVGAGAVAAHAAAIVIKRLVRRKRPHHPSIVVNVGTPSSLSFPSAHATSSTAAALLLARATGSRLPLAVIPAMATSRLVLGVHYPTDVLVGIGVGATVAGATRALADRCGGREENGDE